MNATTAPLPLDFLHALADQLRARSPEARLLFRLVRLHRHLAREAAGPDSALADGLAAVVLRSIEATAWRLRLEG